MCIRDRDKCIKENLNNTIEYKILRDRTNPYYRFVFEINNKIYKIFINTNTRYKIHEAFQSAINNGFFKNITEVDKFIYLNNIIIGYIMPKYTLFKDKYKKLQKETECRLVHPDYIYHFQDKFFKRSENFDIKLHDKIINNNNNESFGSIKIYVKGGWTVWSLPSKQYKIYVRGSYKVLSLPRKQIKIYVKGGWTVWSLPSNYLQLYKQLLENIQSSGIVYTDFIFNNIGVNEDNKCYLYDLESLMYLCDCNSSILKKNYNTLPKYYSQYLLHIVLKAKTV